ncbi:RNA pseudouridylate synthase domain-containing protein, putative [Eimeria maxima]|uniref:RNA pseudouridylate synthase domain-containing protein, putative n=1 Tax=Eimeria maxima TaxID=5804 RepID=U6M9G4_EIMMA|nr:RNA pseudouridylate synthase domain-containing protein, putative [Eimeria maxima]CDJ59688.1 RNA pseudouridylate synthase domain-containing protein, putative [Eimeria maxima]
MATTGASSAVPAQSGEHEERQQLPQRVTAHPKLKETIDAAGLAVHSSPLDRMSERVKVRSQKVSDVLQRLRRCSWAYAHRLLRLKKAFVVPQERSLAEHLKQVNDAKNRKRVASGKFLEPGATLYYPFMNRNNRISNSSTTTARHDCLQQQCAKQELVLFEDEDFIALNKPCGVSIGKLIQQLAIERPKNSALSAEGAEVRREALLCTEVA